MAEASEATTDSVFELSDESFLEMSIDDLTPTTEEDTGTETDEHETGDRDDIDSTDASNDSSADDDIDEDDSDNEEGNDETDSSDNDTQDTDDSTDETDTDETDSTDADTKAEDDGETEDTEKPTDEAAIDYKVEYEKLLAPFKANGVQMQISNVEDAITLMKMGANYHKKMAGLKPSLKVVKLLEKNNLLDPEKISYLIDLNSKDPAAIAKLVKDSGINPLEMDVDDTLEYKPTDREISDNELEIDNVLEDIKSTPTYSKTMQVITEEWDDESRGLIAEAPHIIGLINEHMADGTYDTIATVVTRERSLGRLQGVSDLAAYKAVGDILHQNYQLPGQVKPKAAPTKIKPKKTPDVSDARRKKLKKAASSTKSVKSNQTSLKDINPLAMSDEEFAKISDAQF